MIALVTRRLDVVERLVRLLEAVAAADHRGEGNAVPIADQGVQRPRPVVELAAPLAPNVRMFAVDVHMGIHRHAPGVGVVADDDVAAAVAEHGEAFRHRARVAAGLDHQIGATPRGCRSYPFGPALGIAVRECEGVVSAHPEREVTARRWLTGRHDRSGAGGPGKGDGRQPHRANALHHDAVSESDLGAVHRREPGEQPAAPADEIVDREFGRQDHGPDSRKKEDVVRPSSEQPVLRGIGDAVHPARRTTIRLPRHQALVAGMAGGVNVEEGHHAPDPERTADRVPGYPVRFDHPADADVAGNDRVGNPGKAAVPEMYIGTAHLRSQGLQQDFARSGFRDRNLPDFDGSARRRQHRRPRRSTQTVVPPQLEPAPAVQP